MIEDFPGSNDPTFPKSLYLIGPLFSSYELNTIASGAQASVPLPEGLDLDAWVMAPREPSPQPQHGIGEVPKKRKAKKGKGKFVDLSENGKKTTGDGHTDALMPVESDHETLDTKALGDQVRRLNQHFYSP